MILVLVPKSWGGVEYHRLIIPFDKRHISDVQITPSLEEAKEATYKEYDISQVWFSRHINPENLDPFDIFVRAKRAGVKIVMDMDDYWQLPFGHMSFNQWRDSNLTALYKDCLVSSDYICTTHSMLADTMVRELGISRKKIIIAPNAIDPDEEQYSQDFTYKLSNLFWQGSITHHYDLKQMADVLHRIDKDFTFSIAGFSEHNPETVKLWDEQEKLFSLGERFIRIPAAPARDYMNGYQDKGICLIPLENSKFNRHKSNLKLLEAGWAKKPVIVSGIHPYIPLARHGKNCLMAYTKDAWAQAIKKLLDNPDLADDLRLQLHEDVRKDYTIDKANTSRIDLINYLNR